MIKRWLTYLAVWGLCLILFLTQRQWTCHILFISVCALPPLSLLLMYPTIRSACADVQIPKDLSRGANASLSITVTCRGPKPKWQANMTLQHSFSGRKLRIKPNTSLPVEHCGLLRIHIRGIYLYDYLGLFRFRLTHPDMVEIPVHPEPVPPKSIPELNNRISIRWIPRRGGGYSENHDLRLYRPGDSLHQIHWKLSAKTGKLILREPLEQLCSQLLLRLDLKAPLDELDSKLGQLLLLSQYLLDKQLPHYWQVLTGEGIRSYSITDEESLSKAMDQLLGCSLAKEGSVLDTSSNAAWWHYIGGDSSENT